jgi:hypothetical protein
MPVNDSTSRIVKRNMVVWFLRFGDSCCQREPIPKPSGEIERGRPNRHDDQQRAEAEAHVISLLAAYCYQTRRRGSRLQLVLWLIERGATKRMYGYPAQGQLGISERGPSRHYSCPRNRDATARPVAATKGREKPRITRIARMKQIRSHGWNTDETRIKATETLAEQASIWWCVIQRWEPSDGV